MNFPLAYPIFLFAYWVINTPGIGSIIVALCVLGALGIFGWALRWIARGGQSGDPEPLAYPAPAIKHSDR